MPPRVPPPTPPTTPPFSDWYDHQPLSATRHIAGKLTYLGRDLGADFPCLVAHVIQVCHRKFEFRTLPEWQAPLTEYAKRAANWWVIRRSQTASREPHGMLGPGVDADESGLDVADSHGVHDTLAAREVRRKIHDVLRHMPEGRERSVMFLLIRGWSTESIAKLLFAVRDTVNSTWSSRGRKAFLETWLERHGPGSWPFGDRSASEGAELSG